MFVHVSTLVLYISDFDFESFDLDKFDLDTDITCIYILMSRHVIVSCSFFFIVCEIITIIVKFITLEWSA